MCIIPKDDDNYHGDDDDDYNDNDDEYDDEDQNSHTSAKFEARSPRF